MTKRFITIEGDNRKWKKMERPVLREVPFEATMNEILLDRHAYVSPWISDSGTHCYKLRMTMAPT